MMMEKITVYEKPTCTTCKNLALLFRENGIDYGRVNYFTKPFTHENLTSLIAKSGERPIAFVRGAAAAGIPDDAPDVRVIAAMVADPNLIQRPIIEVGDKVIIARPIGKALELIRG